MVVVEGGGWGVGVTGGGEGQVLQLPVTGVAKCTYINSCFRELQHNMWSQILDKKKVCVSPGDSL